MQDQETIKLKELAIYISQISEDDKKFGSIKLNKIIAFSDMVHYARTGKSITGQKYMKQPQGFVPRQMKPALDSMESNSELVRRPVQRGVYEAKVPTALREANLDVFSAEEVDTVNYVVGELRTHNNGQISDLSHQLTPNWDLIEVGADIPLATLLFPPEYNANADELAYIKGIIQRENLSEAIS